MGRFSRFIGTEVEATPKQVVEEPKKVVITPPTPSTTQETKKIESLSSKLKRNGF